MIDLEYLNSNTKYLVGTDEVGRGPLAGPVVAAAASIKKTSKSEKFLSELLSLGVNDSKKLTDKKRVKIIESLGISRPLKKEISLDQFGISINIKSIVF